MKAPTKIIDIPYFHEVSCVYYWTTIWKGNNKLDTGQRQIKSEYTLNGGLNILTRKNVAANLFTRGIKFVPKNKIQLDRLVGLSVM